MLKTINIDLLYQQLIDHPPLTTDQLHANACSGDANTVDHWRETWIANMKANKEACGSFAENTVGKLYNHNKHRSAIVIGSGPSLAESLDGLRQNQKLKDPLLTISCLHNFGYFVDEGIKVDYYVSLDAGPIVLSDVSEGRKKKDYWKDTKDCTLIAYTCTDPKLLKKWQGKIYYFNTIIPDEPIRGALESIEKFTHYVSTGGNALGACMYIAKAIMGSLAIMYVGADFCFSYDNKFHSYSTGYDNLGSYVIHPDVFGVPRKTWVSYLNFKYWFDKIAMTVPGDWINCSYGLLGAYLGGNIRYFKYMSLETALVPYEMTETVQIEDKDGKNRQGLDLAEFFSDTQYSKDIAFF